MHTPEKKNTIILLQLSLTGLKHGVESTLTLPADGLEPNFLNMVDPPVLLELLVLQV